MEQPTKCQVSETTSSRYRLSRAEFEHAIAAGVFDEDAKIELVNGDLHTMTPEGTRHTAAMNLVARQLGRIFESGAHVRIQNPIAADDHSEPEPDIAVVAGDILDYLDAHPTTALLVVEISDESLNRDRTVKQRLYARSGIPEYWILAIPESRLEVYREPHGDHYASVSRHGAGDTISPLACPGAEIAVRDLLPVR